MNNFKKLNFLILIIIMIFMVGCVSAVDIEDNYNISSENSPSDVAVDDESPLENIDESDVLSSDSVEPTIASDTFDDGKLGDTEPTVKLEFSSSSYSGVYREKVRIGIWFYVYDAPAENFDVKISLDGLKFKQQEFKEIHDSWDNVDYSFNPNTGVLHFDKLKYDSRGWSVFSYYFDAEPVKVGNTSVSVEWVSNSETKTISQIIPIRMGEANLKLMKSYTPFQIRHPTPVYLPNPEFSINNDLLSQPIQKYDDEYLSVPFPRCIGDTLVWYIMIVNYGPNIAFDINVTDNLPEGVIFDSFKASTGSLSDYYKDHDFGNSITYDNKTGVFNIPQLYSNQYAYLTIYTKAITTGLKTNVATVSSATPDHYPSDNEGNASYLVIDRYDLSINKSVWADNETMIKNARFYQNHVNYTIPIIKKGDTVFWLISVSHQGLSYAMNVTVKELLPEGLEIINVYDLIRIYDQENNVWKIDYINSTENYDLENNIWTIGSLNPGQTADLIIETKAVKSGTLTNHAVVSTTSDERNLDNNVGNATVIVEGDNLPVNDTDENPKDNSSDKNITQDSKNNTTSKHVPDDKNSTNIHDSLSETENSKSAVAKSIGSATGNPVLLALMALLLISQNIFRRKK